MTNKKKIIKKKKQHIISVVFGAYSQLYICNRLHTMNATQKSHRTNWGDEEKKNTMKMWNRFVALVWPRAISLQWYQTMLCWLSRGARELDAQLWWEPPVLDWANIFPAWRASIYEQLRERNISRRGWDMSDGGSWGDRDICPNLTRIHFSVWLNEQCVFYPTFFYVFRGKRN